MDNDKEDKSLFQKAIETVKEVASSVTEVITSAPPSQRAEAAPPEENFDAPPMTADELAQHAAADTQGVPSAKKAPRKKPASPNLSGRITPTYDIPVPDTPMPSPKKRKEAVKNSPKKSAKKASKKTAKKAAKKVTKKNCEKVRQENYKEKEGGQPYREEKEGETWLITRLTSTRPRGSGNIHPSTRNGITTPYTRPLTFYVMERWTSASRN